MKIEMLRTKLHRATITRADLNYEGSISIDKDFMDAIGLFANEKVDVLDINNGARFTTYVIEAPRGSKMIGVNGAAARLVQTDDKVIIISYCSIDIANAKSHKPIVALFDDDNNIKELI
jgi:aspartate 1-decarboxylase